MPIFKASQFDSETGKPTGKVEFYLARGKNDALKKVLYTRRLKDARCRVTPTGFPLVICPGRGVWVVTAEKRRRKK
jgi:hypothetical protein